MSHLIFISWYCKAILKTQKESNLTENTEVQNHKNPLKDIWRPDQNKRWENSQVTSKAPVNLE